MHHRSQVIVPDSCAVARIRATVGRVIPLESSSVFAELTPAELEPVKQATEERSYTTGQSIFQQGETGDGIYVVKSGKVEISVVVGSQGERKVFSREGPGALFGEMAVVDNLPRSA
ncbi:MAG TPA: hypothetical protein DCY13_12580, partial [Verrucomicrobiales bacterium]|nr:hypothetical protein [Verrucomicrobiales bacterium]